MTYILHWIYSLSLKSLRGHQRSVSLFVLIITIIILDGLNESNKYMAFWGLEPVAHSSPYEVQKRTAINNGWSEIFIVSVFLGFPNIQIIDILYIHTYIYVLLINAYFGENIMLTERH